MSDEIKEEYIAYLERAKALMGDIPIDQYAKVHGQLIKKLNYEEFAEKWVQYRELVKRYEDGIKRGDTMNDIITQLINERATELLLKQ